MSTPARTTTLLSAAVAFGVAISVLPHAGSTNSAANAQAADGMSPGQLLEEFVHYTRVAKPDLAAGYGQELLDRGISNAELATIVDDGGVDTDRLDTALERALSVPELEPVAGQLMTRIEAGRLDLARESDRIDEAVGMLTGTQRQQMIGRKRLEAAGEFAVPALLTAIVESRDERLRLESTRLLEGEKIGRQAVTPLCAALPALAPVHQETICRVLGQIGYAHAGAALRELSLDDSAPQTVRSAASDAFARVFGGGDDTVSSLYSALARNYFDDLGSLIAYPFEATNNVWSYDDFIGLVPEAVPTSIFNEVMAMSMSAHALSLDSGNREALVLFIASNLKRENDLGDDESDPIYGEADRSPAFYATVFGTDVCQSVLSLALDSIDTPLVRDAIAALSQTTGGSNLLTAGGGRIPLVEALSFPDRRTQYEAALTLGRALPKSSFTGDHRVVPILASAVRTGNANFAIVVCDDDENMRVERERLETLGYTVIGAEPSADMLAPVISDAVGIDLILVRLSDPDAATQTTAELRRLGKTGAAPILVVAAAVDVPRLNREYRGNARTGVTRSVSDEEFEVAVDALVDRASGGRLSDAESDEYSILSLEALGNIAISNSAFFIGDAETALLDALAQRTGSLRAMIADILAYVDSDNAQQALFEAALAASGREQVTLLDATTKSVRQYGDRADRRHIVNLIALVESATLANADAAARLHGALNLQTTDAVRLITGG